MNGFFTRIILVACLAPAFLFADEPPAYPGPNRADEPLRKFSVTAAANFLDSASADWNKQRKCFACHTNYSYLFAQPCLKLESTTATDTRRRLEELVEVNWVTGKPRWDAEVVMAAATLALHDAATTQKLHATTKKALDRIWTIQQEEGGFDWLKCKWPPMESDDHFGAEMALIAVGAAPEKYAESEAAQKGIAKIKQYLAANPPPTVHHEAMLLWAASYLPEVLSAEAKEGTLKKLRQLQRPDGGWSSATLGNWKRGDGKEQDLETSDGYGTGFVIYIFRRSGVPADDPAVVKGIAWLKQNQRASGRWFARSLFKDNHHYLSHAGTAFAVLALDSCAALKE